MTPYQFKPTAALYFFKNGVVEVCSGGYTFTPNTDASSLKPKEDDIVLNRDFVDVDFSNSDFLPILMAHEFV